jgi:hypothetical protein
MSENKYKYLIALKLDKQDNEHPYYDIAIEKMKQYVEHAGYKTMLITEEEAKEMFLPTKEQIEQAEKEDRDEKENQEIKEVKQERENQDEQNAKERQGEEHTTCTHQTTILADIPRDSDEDTKQFMNSLIQMVHQVLHTDTINIIQRTSD